MILYALFQVNKTNRIGLGIFNSAEEAHTAWMKLSWNATDDWIKAVVPIVYEPLLCSKCERLREALKKISGERILDFKPNEDYAACGNMDNAFDEGSSRAYNHCADISDEALTSGERGKA